MDNDKRASSGSSHTNNISEASPRPAGLLGISALALAILTALATPGVSAYAGARPGADDAGAQTFKSNCVVCHGADGTGTTAGKSLKAPDLNSEVQKMTDAQMVEQISNGKNNMPPFESTLSKDQIQSLVAYLRGTFSKKNRR